MPCRFGTSLLSLAVAILTVSRSTAETFQLQPAADALVSSANPANNYGGAGAIAISAPGLAMGEFQSLLRFDLAAAKSHFDASLGVGSWLLTGAALQLTAASPNNPLFNGSAAGEIRSTWIENDSWTEGAGTPSVPGGTGITWNDLPTLLSANDESLGVINFDGATSGTRAYALTASGGFIADVLAGSPSTVLLAADGGDLTVSGLFNSRTFNNPASRPVLSVTAVAVPEPVTALLVGSVAVILLAAKRFRRIR